MTIYELFYWAEKDGMPMLSVMFGNEKAAIDSLKKVWGKEFKTLEERQPHRWFKNDREVAMLVKHEHHLHAVPVELPLAKAA